MLFLKNIHSQISLIMYFLISAQFWLCCSLTLSLTQCFAALLMLPALLNAGQVLWIIFVIIPPLSVSLIGAKVDAGIMKKPLGKNQVVFNTEVS